MRQFNIILIIILDNETNSSLIVKNWIKIVIGLCFVFSYPLLNFKLALGKTQED